MPLFDIQNAPVVNPPGLLSTPKVPKISGGPEAVFSPAEKKDWRHWHSFFSSGMENLSAVSESALSSIPIPENKYGQSAFDRA
jgi:hypothetical protein